MKMPNALPASAAVSYLPQAHHRAGYFYIERHFAAGAAVAPPRFTPKPCHPGG